MNLYLSNRDIVHHFFAVIQMQFYDASVKSHSAFLLAMNNATCSRIAERPYDTPKHEEVAICGANQRIPSVYRIAQASEGSEAIRSIILLVYFDFDLLSTGNL